MNIYELLIYWGTGLVLCFLITPCVNLRSELNDFEKSSYRYGAWMAVWPIMILAYFFTKFNHYRILWINYLMVKDIEKIKEIQSRLEEYKQYFETHQKGGTLNKEYMKGRVVPDNLIKKLNNRINRRELYLEKQKTNFGYNYYTKF